MADLRNCFEGAVPAVVVTADREGNPNVTYLSRVRQVDDERVALSNQFFSKTARNLAENPRASVLLIDPTNYDQYRLTLTYERTERRGPLFQRLKADVELAAALHGMGDVFRLRAADIYRVEDLERAPAEPYRPVEGESWAGRPGAVTPTVDAVARLTTRLGRCADLDTLVGTAVDGLADLGYEHSILLLLDESGDSLFTVASHGYGVEGVGSEVAVGEGFVGLAAARCEPVRFGNIRQMNKYSRSVRRSFEDEGVSTGPEIPVPGLADAESRLAVPAVALGQLVGVLMVESSRPLAFDEADQAVVSVVASMVATAIEAERTATDEPDGSAEVGAGDRPDPGADAAAVPLRFYPADGSTFLDGEYLIKGVAGRLLWSLAGQYVRDGRTEFTNREVRLDPTLELPEFRDNFESRLILLKRRLDEREAPVRIERTGRGRFRLSVSGPLRLELGGSTAVSGGRA
jgi:predicted pyridoxine 5'-phosphate oxidase superfamily flavin-nucleotide-binding protein